MVPAPPASRSRAGSSAILSTVIAPVVIVLSIGAALAASHFWSPEQPTAPSPSESPSTSTEPVGDTMTPTPDEDPEPAPGIRVELDDATFLAPANWELMGDDVLEGERRLVLLREATSGITLQAVTLAEEEDDLTAACHSLVTLQQDLYTDVTTHLVLPAGVPDTGEGVTCGFEGVRTADAVSNTVNFTLLRRTSDGHMLLLRSTVPNETPGDAEPRAQMVTMQCDASIDFGVALPLC